MIRVHRSNTLLYQSELVIIGTMLQRWEQGHYRNTLFSSDLGYQPTSYPVGTGGPFPGGKQRPGRGNDHSPPPHLEPRSRMSSRYTSSPLKRLHGVLWDSFSLTYQM